VATPASHRLDDDYGNANDDVPRADDHNDLLAQLFDDTGLHFNEPGSSIVSSGAEVLSKR
jgi:hypothetical protein